MDSRDSAPERYLNRFSRFFTARPCAQHTQMDTQTHRQTHIHIGHATFDICSNRPRLCTAKLLVYVACKGVLKKQEWYHLYHHAQFGGARISQAAKWRKSSMLVFVLFFFVYQLHFRMAKSVNATSLSARCNTEMILILLIREGSRLCTRVQLCFYNAGRSHSRTTELKIR